MSTSIVIPMLNEAKALPALIRHIAALEPQPLEVVAVDGGSADTSVALVREAGWRVKGVWLSPAAAEAVHACVFDGPYEQPRHIGSVPAWVDADVVGIAFKVELESDRHNLATWDKILRPPLLLVPGRMSF